MTTFRFVSIAKALEGPPLVSIDDVHGIGCEDGGVVQTTYVPSGGAAQMVPICNTAPDSTFNLKGGACGSNPGSGRDAPDAGAPSQPPDGGGSDAGVTGNPEGSADCTGLNAAKCVESLRARRSPLLLRELGAVVDRRPRIGPQLRQVAPYAPDPPGP